MQTSTRLSRCATILAPLTLALVLAGCASSGSSGSGPVPDLAGTRWTVTRIDGNAPLQGTTLTADFGVDGRVNGDSGCNSFSGPYIQDGSSVQIGELLSTRRACTDSRRQRQENRVLILLQGTTMGWLNRDQLTLTAPSGTLMLTPGGFVANTAYPRRVQFDCEGTGLTVVFGGESAELIWSGGSDMLDQRPAASGIWYESPRNTLRGKQQDLTWTRDGDSTRACKELR